MSQSEPLLKFVPVKDGKYIEIYRGEQYLGSLWAANRYRFYPSMGDEVYLTPHDLYRIVSYIDFKTHKEEIKESLTQDFSEALEALGPDIKLLDWFSWNRRGK